MKRYEPALNFLATVTGIISFVWIGLRTDVATIRKAAADIASAPTVWQNWVDMLLLAGPYVLVILAVAWYLIVRRRQISISYHRFKTVQADGRGPASTVDMSAKAEAEIASPEEHFQISIAGTIYGPDLRAIRDRYGAPESIKVYAVVSEDWSAPRRELMWVQGTEHGTLGPLGDYQVRAYLGGTGADSARDGDHYAVRVYIPKRRNRSFVDLSVYDNANPLPRALFLSNPIYIRCRRPN